MSRPLFRNDKPYEVQVTTPSGAGRIVPEGFAVEGNYFFQYYRVSDDLTLLKGKEAENFPREKVLVSIHANSASDGKELTGQEVYGGLSEEHFAPRNAPVKPVEEPKGDMEQQLIKAMAEASGSKLEVDPVLQKGKPGRPPKQAV